MEDRRTTEVRDRVDQDRVPRTDSAAANRAPGSVVAQRVVYYIGGAIMSLLALRFILALLGANRANPFADFIFSLSTPFVAPFFGLFAYEPQYGVVTFELSTLVAIAIYAILTVGIAKLFTLGSRHAEA